MNYLDTVQQVRVRKFAVIECTGTTFPGTTFRVWDDGHIDQWDELANGGLGDYDCLYSNLSIEEEAGIRAMGLDAIKEQQ